jgi:hypothetical protein
MYAEALSEGECEICNTPFYTSHIPCDRLCVDCSEEHNKCQSCAKPINEQDNG